MTPSSAALYSALRLFCLGSFYELCRDVEAGATVQAALDQGSDPSGTRLVEYRPRLDEFITNRADRLLEREDAIDALVALREEPGAGIFGRAEGRDRLGEDEALRRTILLPLLVTTAERCGSFDWDDQAFDRTYQELERRLHGDARVYLGRAPLIGLSAARGIELSPTAAVRLATEGERLSAAPNPSDLPELWGREVDRTLVLELRATVDPREATVPDGPGLVGKAVSALRLTVPGAIAAGPVVFEQLDGFDYSRRDVPELAAARPAGEPTRLDRFRGELAGKVFRELSAGGPDADTLEALDRFEVAQFRQGPDRAEELREGLVCLLGTHEGPWAAAMRGAALVGETVEERATLREGLISLLDGDGPGAAAEHVLRKALIEILLADSREELLAGLDDALLGGDDVATATSDPRPPVQLVAEPATSV